MLVGVDAGVGQGRPPGNSLMQEVINISKTKSERGWVLSSAMNFPHGYGQKTLSVWMEAPIKDIGPGPDVAGGGAVLRLLKIQSIVNTNANTNTNKKYMRPDSNKTLSGKKPW